MTQTHAGPLTESERQTIIHALNVAADVFDNDAAQGAEFEMSERTVKTFREQAKTTRAWAEAIENAGEVIIR